MTQQHPGHTAHPGHSAHDFPTLANLLVDLQRLLVEPRNLALHSQEAVQKVGRLLDNVTQRLATMEQQHAEVRRQMEKLDRKFTEVLSARAAADRPEIPRAEQLRHHEIADRFRFFMSQTVVPVARLMSGTRGKPPAPELVAEATAELCLALFGAEQLTVPHSVQERLRAEPQLAKSLAHMVDEAKALRVEARSLGDGQHFDFTCVGDQPLDAGTQEVFTGFDPNGEVTYVVVPAYRVGEKLIAAQLVATTLLAV